MSTLDALEATYGKADTPPAAVPPASVAETTGGYERRLSSLLRAENGKWDECLRGS